MTQPNLSELITRCEVAHRIGCHPKTIQRAERRGELTPLKFNSRLVRYRRTDVDAWINHAQVGQPQSK